jgi:predicted 3-demethylubiquinone-9 3-methyltransferase (glyoxalase superfamily)
MSKVTPFLWFDGQAEEAAAFHVSLVPGSRITHVTRRGGAGPGPGGAAMTVTFELDGRPFIALNGGPHFKFNEAVSFSVSCDSQEEVDRYWAALTEGGEVALGKLLSDPDPVRSKRVMEAMLGMKKLEIAALRRASDGP